MNVAIIGLGLMGGSLALALRDNKLSNNIIGVDSNESHCSDAMKLRLVDRTMDIRSAIPQVDLIIVATPVAASIKIISDVLDQIKDNQTIVDLGSTKKELCFKFNTHEKRQNYVAAHPIAGTENSGPKSAQLELFKNKKVVVCEKNLSADKALSLAIEMFNKIGMSTVFMTPEEHDKHLAYISHLSHISSFALGLTVLDLEKDDKNIFNLAGSGFSSTARLAKSSPQMWNAILAQNKDHVLPALDAYILHLNAFRQDIFNNNQEKLTSKMMEANNIRRIIK